MTNPVLVEVYRAGILESFHRGVICVVDKKGDVIFSRGDIHQLCYPRSAMKFLQVLPLIENGGIDKFGLTLEEIAVMCGSHNAEADHLRVVNSILNKINLNKEHLECGAQNPSSKKDYEELIKNNQKSHSIHNNCSGKHAGMLALCVLMSFETKNYINPDHPAQKLILDVAEQMYEFPRSKMQTALDGCSAPIYSVPVFNQALSFANLAASNKFDEKRRNACKIVIEAISTYPFMVAGSKRYCTDLMKICAPKIVGKTGAEGIFCLTLTEQQIGVCIKIDDGKMLPQYNVAQAFVEATKLFEKEELAPLNHYKLTDIKNFNKLVSGEIKVTEGLFDDLKI